MLKIRYRIYDWFRELVRSRTPSVIHWPRYSRSRTKFDNVRMFENSFTAWSESMLARRIGLFSKEYGIPFDRHPDPGSIVITVSYGVSTEEWHRWELEYTKDGPVVWLKGMKSPRTLTVRFNDETWEQRFRRKNART